MSHFYSITIILRRIDQEISKFANTPLYIFTDTTGQLLIKKNVEKDHFTGFCIEQNDDLGILTIKPVDNNFTLFLFLGENLESVEVNEEITLPLSFALGLSNSEGPEWDIIIENTSKESIKHCQTCREFYFIDQTSCPYCGQRQMINLDEEHNPDQTLPYGVIKEDLFGSKNIIEFLQDKSTLTNDSQNINERPPKANQNLLIIIFIVIVLSTVIYLNFS
jgi:hypothetical protein